MNKLLQKYGILPLFYQFFRKMKLTILFLTVSILSCMSAETYSQTTKLTIAENNSTLLNVLQAIEAQSEFKFFYNEKVDVNRPVSIDANKKTVTEILDKVLTNTSVKYKVIGSQIALYDKNEMEPFVSEQQGIKITGKVTDSSGASLPGVSIVEKGTTTGIITDMDGNFSLTISPNAKTLVFSFMGMKSQELVIGNKTTINVVMEDESIGLNEIVTIGYGTVKKSDVTGSVASVKIKDIGDRQNPDIATLLQGSVAGVEVNAGQIRVRGVTTFNNSDPLIIIDGFFGGNLSTVNPNDIASIEVLKDGSSTAIYGAKGANGVILITTKSGTTEPLKVNINVNSGFAMASKKLDVLNANQYIDLVTEGMTNAKMTIPDKFLTPGVRKDVTNWQDEVFRTGHSNSVDMNFAGGTNKATFYMSMGYKHFDDIVIGPQYDQISMRLKNDFKLTKWLKFGNNVGLSYKMANGSMPGDPSAMITMPPYIHVRDASNYWGYGTTDRNIDLNEAYNPVASSVLTHPKSNGFEYMANIYADITFMKGLVYHIQTGVTGSFNHNTRWDDQFNDNAGKTIANNYSEYSSYYLDPILESYLAYTHKFKKHDLSIMAGNTYENFVTSGNLSISGNDYANTLVKNVSYAATRGNPADESNVFASLSYFGRLNYQFDNKYLLTMNIRHDGSPRFAQNNRFGNFPSVAVAWKMHEEGFIRGLNIFDQLKLRASWGISGNDGIGNFQYVSQVWRKSVYYPLGTTPTLNVGATVIDDSSQAIKWESTTSKTIGLDMAFLKNRLTVTGEYFIKNSNDILFAVPRPISLGYGQFVTGGNPLVNAASCTNKGFELQVGYKNKIGLFNYSLDANYSHVNNNVTSLGLGGVPYMVANISRTDIGNPIGYFYGYEADGVFMTQASLDAANQSARDAALKTNPQLTPTELSQVYYELAATSAGDVRYKDINGDGKVTDLDRTKIGNSIPTSYYGLSINLDYKGFDFNVLFQGIAGSDLFFNGYQNTRGMWSVKNQEAYVLNRWRSEQNPGNGIVPRAIIGDPAQNMRPSTLMVESGDYLKVKQLSFGYSLPIRISEKVGLSKLRIYASAANVLTLTKYSGYDPEYGGSNLTRGVNWLNYPSPRTFSLGVQIGL